MHLLLLHAARAADMTGECPEIAEPEDAFGYYSVGDLGTNDVMERLARLALSWLDTDCLSDCDTDSDTGTVCFDGTCTDSAGNVVDAHYEGNALRSDTGFEPPWVHQGDYALDIDVSPAAVETPSWTQLSLTIDHADGTSWSGAEGWSTTDWEASWTGTVDTGLPENGAIVAGETWLDEDSYLSRTEAWDDGTCAWSAEEVETLQPTYIEACVEWNITVDGVDVEVSDCDSTWCDGRLSNGWLYSWEPTWGWIDGALVGEVDLVTWGAYTDADRDGYSVEHYDCDDADPDVNPCADEIAGDGIDNDCDGVGGPADADHDGEPADTDCDDADADVHTGAAELCDGVDDDCDGEVDEADATDAEAWYLDADGDGFGSATSTTACSAPAGYVAEARDCDDGDAAISPAGTETCDGVDDDCDGEVDEADAAGAPTWYADADGDGYGSTSSTTACAAPSGYVADATDCDDGAAATNRGAIELCDGDDDDCDGTVDEADAADAATWYLDADGDGYGTAVTSATACDAPAGFVADATDCDDGSSAVSPAATETCDGADDDCDGAVDEGDAADASTWYADGDGDGVGGYTTATACTMPSGYVAGTGDCDDTDRDKAMYTWYADADGDGYGDATATVEVCDPPEGYVGNARDCDDADAAVSPAADEVWYDGVDEACDGGDDDDQDGDGQASADHGGEDCDDTDAAVYAGAPDDPYDGVVTDCGSTWEYDADHDGYLAQSGGGDDCDDTSAGVNPGATEAWYDGVDQDCDGDDDDQDGDGLAVADDCDDTDAAVGACEVDTADTAEPEAPPSTDDDGDTDCGGCDSGGVGRQAVLTIGLALVLRRRAG